MFDRSILEAPAIEVAPLLLGAVISKTTDEGTVSVRLTEVEAYLGAVDPGSHAFRGRTARNGVMFGGPGFLYTYFTYGMHVCANVVCSPVGTATAVLLRAGEVIDGHDLARHRRSTSKTDADLARGPARLVMAMGIELSDGGADLAAPPFDLELPASVSSYQTGPRTGVSGAGGTAEFPWRFWIPGDRTVSPYKASVPKKRAAR
ncbi:DNA-3-methyladenine glycosylase [Lacisediminihabitans changchengi]|uniref:Putative 3-methyladenine DNA glycosylase n=1 Tax=Lacisediminihabitans changchengi TaxID=2787634 RepID=A0A934W4M6_9MICO|nr:DNA-3-methyladenine glycosylase [Lacisediminihabitans changchengi]MBK4347640.1 DNA-3-methyladenine glycosylase [Lacisediminihabitans changchengi]